MSNEFKIKNGAIVNGTVYAGQTGFNASGVFSGDTIGAIVLSTTGSTGFSILSTSGTYSIYDNTNAATRFYIGSGGNVGIGTSSPQAKLHIDGTVRIDNQIGTPGSPATPGTPTEGYGIDNSKYLGEPPVWFKINIDGSDYYLPGYQ
jgi:hypothetical protein